MFSAPMGHAAALPPRQRWHRALPPAVILCAAVILISPWQMVDPDALSHLTIGRVIVQEGKVPVTDPLTFSQPLARWSNPEWAGDTLLYLVYRIAGEDGLILFKIGVLCVGFLLTLFLGKKQGGATTLVLILLLLALVGAPGRFTLRNHIHAYWLVPLYGMILARRREHPGGVLLLIPLGILWANLHGSFPLGWVMITAALVQALVDPPGGHRTKRTPILSTAPDLALGGILLLHPLLAMISPLGYHNYGQLVDHLLGAPIYRQLIMEWQPPSQAASLLAPLPLHLLGLAGLLSFLPRVNRRQVGALILLIAGLALAHSSQRFIPMMAVLVVPGLAANLTRWLEQRKPRSRWLLQASVWIIALGTLLPVIYAARTDVRRHVLTRSSAPAKTVRFIAREAPSGSRLFNPFNTGPWLLWGITPRTQIFIDPRNNLGAEALRRYVEELLPDGRRFEMEARRLRIGLALMDLSDGRMTALNQHLRGSSAWRLVFWEGRYALYARASEANRGLIKQHGYRINRSIKMMRFRR